MQLQSIKISDVDMIIKLWNNSFSKNYRITKEIFMEKVLNDLDFFNEGSFCVIEDGKCIGLIVSKINNDLDEYKNCGWISVLITDKNHRRISIGSNLYNSAEQQLELKGIEKIILGGELNNFFSGIPDPNTDSVAFFEHRDFKINEFHYDLLNDVSTMDFDKLEVELNMEKSITTKEMINEDKIELNKFFDRNFPGRWKYEINNYILNDGDLKDIILMFDDESIIGFCKITENTSLFGALGPIGVDDEYRGRKLGNRLLGDSLKYLKVRGMHDVNIDWTILKDFYGQFGFKPWKIYKGGVKKIGGIKYE